MKKTLKLLTIGFESSTRNTPEFNSFFRTFKSEFSKELKSIGATNIKIEAGHFYISGFFTSPSGQIYYFSLPDVRGMEYILQRGCSVELMYRTAKDYKDFTGGPNQWVKIETGMGQKMNII